LSGEINKERLASEYRVNLSSITDAELNLLKREVNMQTLLTEGRLRTHRFLEGADGEFLNHLEEFSQERNLPANTFLFHEGDYADRCYLLLSGRIALKMESDCALPELLDIIGPGRVVGWSWLFPPFKWHLSARTLEPCEAVVLDGAALLIRAEEDPKFGFELLRRLSKQVILRLQSTRSRLAMEIAKKNTQGCLGN
jgi:CRP/FNR family transcriptional regulator, cyclic AMP receptor protein